jgi:hypothetical protein
VIEVVVELELNLNGMERTKAQAGIRSYSTSRFQRVLHVLDGT